VFRVVGSIAVAASALCAPLAQAEDARDHEIAARFAPVIYQETGSRPKADAITSFDFDGDWNAYNNWENLKHFPTPAYVYYSMIESETHYFITYGLFHPQDYTRICLPFVCHENDMEGAHLTVQKTDDGAGRVVFVETKAHGGMPKTKAPFLVDGRVALRVEKQGHGVYPMSAREHTEFQRKSNVLEYVFTGQPDDPNSARAGRFGYELTSMFDTLWARRTEIGRNKAYRGEYEYGGTRFDLGKIASRFGGAKWAGSVSPPWAWNGRGAKSDWFFDPAFHRRNEEGLGQPFSTDYVRNSFVHIQ
jgi:hypothetical protein